MRAALLVIALSTAPSWAQVPSFRGDDLYVNPTFNGSSSRVIGLGGSYVPSAEGIDGMTLNIASLANRPRDAVNFFAREPILSFSEPSSSDPPVRVRRVHGPLGVVIGPDKKVKLTLTYPASTGKPSHLLAYDISGLYDRPHGPSRGLERSKFEAFRAAPRHVTQRAARRPPGRAATPLRPTATARRRAPPR